MTQANLHIYLNRGIQRVRLRSTVSIATHQTGLAACPLHSHPQPFSRACDSLDLVDFLGSAHHRNRSPKAGRRQ